MSESERSYLEGPERVRKKFEIDLNAFIKMAALVLVVACLIFSAKLLLDYNDAVAEQKRKQALIEELMLERDYLLYELECEFDRDYVIRVAREQLGLVLPNEITYLYGVSSKPKG